VDRHFAVDGGLVVSFEEVRVARLLALGLQGDADEVAAGVDEGERRSGGGRVLAPPEGVEPILVRSPGRGHKD
jgi:hypothetical protein